MRAYNDIAAGNALHQVCILGIQRMPNIQRMHEVCS